MSSPNSFNFDVVENNQNGAGAAQPPQGRVTLTVDELIQSTVRALMFQQEEARLLCRQALLRRLRDDVEGWLERVDAVRSTYEVPDNIIKLIAVGKLRGDAKGWYQSKVQYITMAWNDFKTEMKQMFKKRLNKVEVMREFEARKWTRGEDFTKYYADKVRLGNKARLGEEDILQYLIDGIENRMLQNFVRINNPFELTDVLTIMKDVKNEDRKLSSTKSAPTSVSSSEKSQTTKKSTRCYNCNAEGHVASKCTQAKRPPGSCFCCGSPDHQLKNCPKRDKPQISVIEAKAPSDCTVQNAAFKFGDDELVAFETLKDSLVDAPLLAIYSPLLETELHCDASSKGFGAILLQKQDDGKFRPVRYLSKRTTESESKLHSYELELLAIVYAVEKFHVYLHGLRFKVVTDSDAVKMALNKKDINPRISRWALVLENYDYTVEHRAGKRMQHVDALSRCTPVMVIEENTFEQNLAIAQNLDPVIKALKSELEVRESKKFELRNGLVYRKANDKLLFYVPSLMEQNILTLCHDNLGHFGFDKSYEYLSRAYWFPDARQKVRVHIKNCLKCITYASVTGKTEGFLHNIPKGDKPFMTIHVDHYGPLEKTPTGKKFILEVIDSFTKFVTLFAVLQCTIPLNF
ncbi:hypothetical protein GEV33_000009 [Tenebrio molitor]|uniref:RNA-directed DNA polymerase n=1 Tax=Tenebrio molitor TaxID=7067 RepID=A0A8J6HYD5_TENMO|nr:hypothetical protein GEV33_000009 [Tenebrio molitor]